MVCPYTGLKKKCVEGDCPKWVSVSMQDPQTGKVVNEYGCADYWSHVAMMDLTKRTIDMGAIIESLRNETLRALNELGNLYAAAENEHIKKSDAALRAIGTYVSEKITHSEMIG